MTKDNLILDFDGRRLQGLRPFALFEARGGAWQWQGMKAEWPFQDGTGDALAEVQRALRWARQHIGSAGAAIGFISYDCARQLEPRAFGVASPTDDLDVPDIRLAFCKQLEISATPLTNRSAPLAPGRQSPPKAELANAAYLATVTQIQGYIAAGDIYQANLTQRFTAPLPCSPHALYEQLRQAHPMPFTALLEWDDIAIVSNSPERFLKLEGRHLTAQPIKGTMRRGQTKVEDARFKQNLRDSIKDRAENVMIVDLLRNDIGRVCEYGTVAVPQLCAAATFPTLHHLVSTVTGTLREGLDGVDAVRAAFPCGSITGAPKIRAMQIIDELELVRRGVAMGALGYFGFDGDMEWNVAIRTITCMEDTAYFHVGGGIVADSVPEAEYAEMMLKAKALRAALAGTTDEHG